MGKKEKLKCQVRGCSATAKYRVLYKLTKMCVVMCEDCAMEALLMYPQLKALKIK